MWLVEYVDPAVHPSRGETARSALNDVIVRHVTVVPRITGHSYGTGVSGCWTHVPHAVGGSADNVGVAQGMHEGTDIAVSVRASANLNARRMRYCSAPRVIRGPSTPTNSGAVVGQRRRPGTSPQDRHRVLVGKRVPRLAR